MKRVIKLLLNFFLALIAVGLTLLVVFFMTPSWQKSALEEVLSRDTTRSWQVENVHLQPGSLSAENVFVMDGHVGAGIRYAELTGPFWKLPFTQFVDIDEGSIAGLDLDVSRIRVGDPTSLDYQAFLRRVSGDEEFWKERIGLVLSKLTASGVRVRVKNLQISGVVRMPGDKEVPVRWTILEADSSFPRLTRIQPTVTKREEL